MTRSDLIKALQEDKEKEDSAELIVMLIGGEGGEKLK